MDATLLETFDRSLARCNARQGFLDRFYERFLSMSPKVAEKFAGTDFVRQKRALRASFHMMLLAAGEGEKGPERYLRQLAISHGRDQLDVGAEFYDYWLDSLLAAVREFDDEWNHDVEAAWEEVLGVGIDYLLRHYNDPPRDSTA